MEKRRSSPRKSPSLEGSRKETLASRHFSYGALEIDGSLEQVLSLLATNKGVVLNTLLILEQLVAEWDRSIDEVQEHVMGLELEDKEPRGLSDEADVTDEGNDDVSCFLLEKAEDLDASFKRAGHPSGLDDAKSIVDHLAAVADNACSGVGLGSHTTLERAEAYSPLRGRAWYTWTLDDVQPMIHLLRKNAACRADSLNNVPPEDEIHPWTKFLSQHWGINAYLDPYIIIGEGDGAMPAIGPVGIAVNPLAPGWKSVYTTNNRNHAMIRAGAWRQAGAARVCVATYSAGTLLHF